jgi:hypothetical protein
MAVVGLLALVMLVSGCAMSISSTNGRLPELANSAPAYRGVVEGRVSRFCGLFGIFSGSPNAQDLERAEARALEGTPDADRLIDATYSSKHTIAMGLFSLCITRVQGTPGRAGAAAAAPEAPTSQAPASAAVPAGVVPLPSDSTSASSEVAPTPIVARSPDAVRVGARLQFGTGGSPFPNYAQGRRFNIGLLARKPVSPALAFETGLDYWLLRHAGYAAEFDFFGYGQDFALVLHTMSVPIHLLGGGLVAESVRIEGGAGLSTGAVLTTTQGGVGTGLDRLRLDADALVRVLYTGLEDVSLGFQFQLSRSMASLFDGYDDWRLVGGLVLVRN